MRINGRNPSGHAPAAANKGRRRRRGSHVPEIRGMGVLKYGGSRSRESSKKRREGRREESNKKNLRKYESKSRIG